MNEYEIYLIGFNFQQGGAAYAYQVNGGKPVIAFSLFAYDIDHIELIALHAAISSLPNGSKIFPYIRQSLVKKMIQEPRFFQDRGLQPEWATLQMTSKIKFLCFMKNMALYSLVSDYDQVKPSTMKRSPTRPEALLLRAIEEKADTYTEDIPSYGFPGFEYLAHEFDELLPPVDLETDADLITHYLD